MAECVVVADDLTGGNATGVLLTKLDYRAVTVMNADSVSEGLLARCDCVIYPTDSRGMDAEDAYRCVCQATNLLKRDGIKLYAHRIDSTLRGNLGRETDAMLDCLGKDYVAIAVPGFPSSGRTVAGGYLLVDGLPVNKTNIALDPKTPVKTALVQEVFQRQSHYGVASVEFCHMQSGKHLLAARILETVRQGARIITFDCVTQEDLDLIADAVITSGLKVIAVDPGAFTATLARKQITPTEKREKNRILVLVGSVNANTKRQLEELWLTQHPIDNGLVKTKCLLAGEEARKAEVERVVAEILEHADRNSVLTVVGDGIYPENRIRFEPYMEKLHCSLDAVTGIINDSLAQIAERILKGNPSVQALYSSGGDVTQAVCRRFGAAGLNLKDEVLPLAAYGEFLGGSFDRLKIVTKGGSQGNQNAINFCVNYLKEKLFI